MYICIFVYKPTYIFNILLNILSFIILYCLVSIKNHPGAIFTPHEYMRVYSYVCIVN